MVTIKDVAKKSGFSIATVSAVINGVPIVSPKAKEQILQAIKELGYRPNAIARSLKNAKTSSIAILVRDITNPFYPEIVSGLEDVAWANNYEVFLCNTENSLEREQKYIDNLIDKRVDGIILTTSSLERKDYLDRLQIHGIPYIFLNRRPNQLLKDEYFVGVDNKLASIKVVDYLNQLGYRRIAFLGGPQELSTFRDRSQGFLEGMEKNGLTIHDKWFLQGDFTKQRGYNEAKMLIERKDLPEVIFCSSDLMAFGVYLAFKENGINIPDDVALISIDNNMFGELIDLSSVDMRNKEMGRKVAEKLIHLMKNEEETHSQELLLEPKLVIRKSCGGSRLAKRRHEM